MTTGRDVIAEAITESALVYDEDYAAADRVLAELQVAPEPVRLELAGKLNPWRPIETAPKDRQFHLLYCAEDGSIWLAAWQTDQWYGVDDQGLTRSSNAFAPTHWLPLPAPPSEDK